MGHVDEEVWAERESRKRNTNPIDSIFFIFMHTLSLSLTLELLGGIGKTKIMAWLRKTERGIVITGFNAKVFIFIFIFSWSQEINS